MLVANLVHQQSTSTGTGNFTLASVNGKQTFDTAFSHGSTTDVFPYFISNQDAAEYEWGTGHMSDATTLVRDTVLGGSNGTSPVDFSAGTKDLTNDIFASKQVTIDGAETLTNKTISLDDNTVNFTPPGSGAVSRSVSGRLAEIVSVKDFGATGDGTTDDADALQDALDSNQVCALPPGRYRTTRTLRGNPAVNRGNGFIGLGVPSLYSATSQSPGPTWDGTQEPVIFYDGPSVDDLSTTSSTSTAIGTGSKTFTVGSGKSFAAAMEITIRRTSAPTTTYMYGTVTSYSGTSLVIDVDVVLGSGTFTDWTITVPTACLAVSNSPLTIEPDNTFSATPYGFKLHNVGFDGNDKALYGYYSARLQDGDVFNIIATRCKGDGIYINGSYSGNYQKLTGWKNWGRGVSLGAATLDYGWSDQGHLNRVTFLDVWGYTNGKAGDYEETDLTGRRAGCGIYFAPHRGCGLIGWTAENNDGAGLVFAPTSNANIVLNGYTELNSVNDITGAGSAIDDGRASRQTGIEFYGAAAGASYGNIVDTAYLASEDLWLTGSAPSSTNQPPIFKSLFGGGSAVQGYQNYRLVDCDPSYTTGQNGQSHGSWTPVLEGATTPGTNTYTIQAGGYHVENGVVTCWFTIILSAVGGTMAGALQITGLPYAAKNYPSGIKYAANFGEWILGVSGQPAGFVAGGDQFITIKKYTGGANTNTSMVPADLSSTSRLVGSVQYRYF